MVLNQRKQGLEPMSHVTAATRQRVASEPTPTRTLMDEREAAFKRVSIPQNQLNCKALTWKLYGKTQAQVYRALSKISVEEKVYVAVASDCTVALNRSTAGAIQAIRAGDHREGKGAVTNTYDGGADTTGDL